MTIDNGERAMNRSIRRQAMEARRAPALLQEREAEMGNPPRYLYVDGNAYMLASHAAAQMERVILAVSMHVAPCTVNQMDIYLRHSVEPGGIVKVTA